MKNQYIDEIKHRDLLKCFEIDPIKYKGILCPLKGGFHTAYPISMKYNLPLHFIHLCSYEGKEQKKIDLKSYDHLDSGHYLICDDIYDSGETIKLIKWLYEFCTFDVYCLVSKQDIDIMYGELVDKGVWVDFWYENKNYFITNK